MSASSRSRTRPEPKLDNNTDGPWIPRQESRIILSPIIIPPPTSAPSKPDKPPELPKLTPAQQKLKNAINIDRFSRVFFPFSFAMLNLTYWVVFWEYV